MSDEELTPEERHELCPHPPALLMPMQDGTSACGVCGATGLVVNTDNAATEEAAPPQVPELVEQINEIAEKFDRYGFNLNQLYDKPLVMALQGNAIAQLLIKKGFFTKEEMDLQFYSLVLAKYQEHERVILPQLREAQIRANLPGSNGNLQQQVQHLLGPDGKPLI